MEAANNGCCKTTVILVRIVLMRNFLFYVEVFAKKSSVNSVAIYSSSIEMSAVLFLSPSEMQVLHGSKEQKVREKTDNFMIGAQF
jgi:hypothetical protein